MESERFDRAQKTARLHFAMEAEETLKNIEEFPEKPAAMGYFFELFRRIKAGEPVAPNGEKLIGTMCVQVPDELIYAAGARPLRLCSGANSYDQFGAEFMPSKSCPLVKASIGMLYVNQDYFGRNLEAVVVPMTCDQKRKSTEILDTFGYKTYMLEMPATRDSDAARYYWQESVRKFAKALQKMTGKKITSSGLQKAMERTGRAAAEFRRLHNLQKSNPTLIYGSDVLLVNNAYFYDDIDSWTDAVAELNQELEQRQARGDHAGNTRAPRILMTGSPPVFPNLKVPLLVEQAGAVVAADEFCSSSRLLYDVPAYSEARLYDMVPAVADRYLKPCTCPCFSPNLDRQRRLLELAKSAEVDGVIYQAFSGCMPYEMEQKQINTVLTEANIPMLYVETDYSPEDKGQLSTRVEAFLESIKARKRRAA